MPRCCACETCLCSPICSTFATCFLQLGAIVQRNLGMCLMENNQTYNGTDALRIVSLKKSVKHTWDLVYIRTYIRTMGLYSRVCHCECCHHFITHGCGRSLADFACYVPWFQSMYVYVYPLWSCMLHMYILYMARQCA